MAYASQEQSKSASLVWFRDDLRLGDNPALRAAVDAGGPVLCVFILDEETKGLRPHGAASKWWLHGSLAALDDALRKCGSRLDILRGKADDLIPRIAKALGAEFVFWNRRYGAAEIEQDKAIKAHLKEHGVAAESFNAHLLYEPWTVTTKTGDPCKVFTPFWRAARATGEPREPLPAPREIAGADWPAEAPKHVALKDLALEPTKPDWAGGMRDFWERGEHGAHARLRHFLKHGLKGYGDNRNRPDLKDSTSHLSPHLRFGEIGPRQIWHAATSAVLSGESPGTRSDLDKFLSEIGWREFSYHLLFHNPDLARTNFQPKFDDFPWKHDPDGLSAWHKGLTGYPIVDAGMRQLWETGWMHNRVRMIAASFLIKDLLIDWRIGEDWFWDTLVDADPANNAASWQWVAGSGADAAPYFRIFNPILQGEKFDTDGDYVRRFVPELAKLPAKWIHRPFEAPRDVLLAAGVRLGETYPRPIVEHDKARDRALAALESLKPSAA
jgi:deoxyribodipyrimidine photo-lyase